MNDRPVLNVLMQEGTTRRDFVRRLGLAGLGAGLVQALPSRAVEARGTLNYFCWSPYGGAPFIANAQKLDIELRTTFFASYDEMLAKLRGGGTKLYDMISLGHHYSTLAIETDLVEPMDRSKMTNIRDLFPEFVGQRYWEVGGKFYAAPFVWGANALAYNRKVMGEIDSINVLFDPKWKGRVTMRDAAEDSLAVAALKLGIKKPYEMDENALQEVKKLLIAQKPLVRAYWKGAADLQNMLATGEVVVAWAFLAVIVPLRKAGLDAQWVWPKEGVLGFSQAVAAVKGTKNKGLVETYANHTLGRDYGEMLIKDTRYATTSKAVVDRLDPKLVEEIGLDPKNMGRVVFKETPRNKARWDEVWNEVKNA